MLNPNSFACHLNLNKMKHLLFILLSTLMCSLFVQAQIFPPLARPIKCVMSNYFKSDSSDNSSNTDSWYEKVLIEADVPCVHKIVFIMETVGHRLNEMILGSAHLYPDKSGDDRRRRQQRGRTLQYCDPRCPGRINSYCTYFWCGNRRRKLQSSTGNTNHTLRTVENSAEHEETEQRLLQNGAEIYGAESLALTAQSELRILAVNETERECRRFLKRAICSPV